MTDRANEAPLTSPFYAKRRRRLADGRQILYFDESEHADHPDDRRSLNAATTTSVMRRDLLLGEWVTIASHRQDRTHLPREAECPLCPSTSDHGTEIPSADYDVAVFENRFPTFTSASEAIAGGACPAASTTTLFDQRTGVGRCEVISFTAQHHISFSQLPPSRVRTILSAWIDRSVELTGLPYVEQVFCFENRGEETGVTLSHPHGQIYAYPFVTPRTQRMLDNARCYQQKTSRNLFADLLEAESEFGERIVIRGKHWTAFVPFAARWPLEVHLYPNRQLAALSDLSSQEQEEFSSIYPALLRQMESAFGFPLPYIAAWHQAPTRVDRELSYLHLQITSIRRAPGKLKYLAGSEAAMGAFINDVLPEDAARRLRAAHV